MALRSPGRRPFGAASLLALVAQGGCPLGAVGCTASDSATDHDPPALATTAEFTDDDPVRVKGLRPHLVIHRKRGATIERIESDAMARVGDLVQVSYVAAGNRHGVIVSLDNRGVVTLHHPIDVRIPAQLVMRGEQALGHAYELDDAADFERFIFVTSGDLALDVDTVLRAATDLAHGRAAEHDALGLPSPWQQSSLTLTKAPSTPP